MCQRYPGQPCQAHQLFSGKHHFRPALELKVTHNCDGKITIFHHICAHDHTVPFQFALLNDAARGRDTFFCGKVIHHWTFASGCSLGLVPWRRKHPEQHVEQCCGAQRSSRARLVLTAPFGCGARPWEDKRPPRLCLDIQDFRWAPGSALMQLQLPSFQSRQCERDALRRCPRAANRSGPGQPDGSLCFHLHFRVRRHFQCKFCFQNPVCAEHLTQRLFAHKW